ncbi:MAG: NAD(P)/FAD-dependent oxidoreductase [Myxococcota bacterium]
MTEKIPVVVIGAGPAGIAVSACLRRHGVNHVVLEREQSVAPRWRNHYDRLHLHTARNLSALPYRPFPKGVPQFPSRKEVVAYMDDYAAAHGVNPLFCQEVKRASRRNRKWRVETQDRLFEAEGLVVATGYNRKPYSPTWPGMDTFKGEILHSRDYRNGAAWTGKRALVVGAGNTGAEIAVCLHEHGAKPTLCIRGPIHVMPRSLNGLPTQFSSLVLSKLPLPLADGIGRTVSKTVFGDLSPWGITRPDVGPMRQIVEQGRIPLIDVGTVELVRNGDIQVAPGIERFTAEGVEFVDGQSGIYDVVVLATGYRAALEGFLDEAERYVDDRGYPRVHGANANLPDPFFVGYGNPPTGQLREIRQHAIAVAKKLSRSVGITEGLRA